MNIKKIIFALSAVSVMALTSCGNSNLTHEISKTLRAYQVDLNHDGYIHEFPDPDKPSEMIQEDNLTWIEAYDRLIKEANSMKELNLIADALNIAKDELKRTSLARYEILHEAEELLMNTGANLPIYNYGDPYILKPGITGIYTMNLGYKFLDKLEWEGHENKFTISVGTKAETFDPASNSDVSTTIAMNQFLIGAMRYVDGGQDPLEKEGIHIATLGDGVCDVKKQLVVKTQAEADKDHIWYEDCSDLKAAIDSGLEKIEDYEGTARYTLTMKDGAVWNDGSDITIDDFIYSWARASSGVYNGQPFGVWCTMFDMIRGYKAWNAIGQQPSNNPDDWDEDAQFIWTNTDEKQGTVLTDAERAQWMQSWEKNGCAGGMAGVMKHEGAGGAKDTLVVQLINDCDYFESLLAAPMFMPVAKKNVLIVPAGKSEKTAICEEDTDWWMNKNHDYLTNGPMEIDGPIDNVDSGGMKLKKATHFTPGIKIEDATTESIEFKFIDKDSTIYDSYKSNVIQFTNQFPSGVIDDLMTKPDWHAAQQLGLFYYSFNVNDNTFDIRPNMSEEDRQNLRKAVCLLVNRDDISTNVAKKGCYASNGFVSDGIMESCVPELRDDGKIWAKVDEDGEYVTANWQDRNLDAYQYLGTTTEAQAQYKAHIMENRGPGGFYKIIDEEHDEEQVMRENTAKAIELVEKAGIKYDRNTGKFVNFPRLSVLTNNGSGLEDIAERMQAYLGLWGIDMSIATQEWQSFLATRRIGDFAIARQGWVADYNDPRTYLDLCCSDSGNNDTQLGRDKTHRSH